MSEVVTNPRRGKLSASGIEQAFLCPGAPNAQRAIPEIVNDEGGVRDSGVRIHAALSGDIDALQKLSSPDLSVYEDMRDKAGELVESLGFDPNRFIAEQRIYFPDADNPEFSGQPDRVYLRDGKALTLDWKSGFLPVTTADKNAQLATLAILTIHKYGVSEVTVCIVPRFGKIKETATYDLSSATSALEFIRWIIAESEKPDAPRRAGNKQCKYCRFAPHCPEYHEFSMAVQKVEHAELPTISSADLAQLIDRIPAVLNLCEKLKDEGKRRLDAGDEEFSKLFELTQGRKTRKITDLFALYNRCKLLGASDAAFTGQCTIDLGAVDKDGNGKGLKYLIHVHTGLKGKALDQKTEEVLSGLIEVGRTAGSLKRKDA